MIDDAKPAYQAFLAIHSAPPPSTRMREWAKREGVDVPKNVSSLWAAADWLAPCWHIVRWATARAHPDARHTHLIPITDNPA